MAAVSRSANVPSGSTTPRSTRRLRPIRASAARPVSSQKARLTRRTVGAGRDRSARCSRTVAAGARSSSRRKSRSSSNRQSVLRARGTTLGRGRGAVGFVYRAKRTVANSRAKALASPRQGRVGEMAAQILGDQPGARAPCRLGMQPDRGGRRLERRHPLGQQARRSGQPARRRCRPSPAPAAPPPGSRPARPGPPPPYPRP